MHPRTLLLIVVALAVALLLVGVAIGRLLAEADLAAAEALRVERAAVVQAGASPATVGTRRDVERAAAPLREQTRRLERAVGPTVPVAAGEASTGSTVAHGVPVPEQQTGSKPSDSARLNAPSSVDRPGCLLAESDPAEIAVTWQVRRARRGTLALAGIARAFRLSADGVRELQVIEAEIDPESTTWVVQQIARRPRWAVSGEAGVSVDGPVYSGAVERRLSGPVWAGLAAGSVGRVGYVSARLRVEW